MFRWTFTLAMAAALLVATASETQAQHRRPLRNLLRGLGAGWSHGYHWRNPGHVNYHYHPWNQYNSSRFLGTDGAGLPENGSNTTPPGENTEPTPHPDEVIQWQQRGHGQTNTQTGNFRWPETQATQGNWNSGIQSDLSRQLRINRYLKPYGNRTPSPSAIQLDRGGSFQIDPNDIPADNTGWRTPLQRSFEESKPFSNSRDR